MPQPITRRPRRPSAERWIILAAIAAYGLLIAIVLGFRL